jgi:hypothetical protein
MAYVLLKRYIKPRRYKYVVGGASIPKHSSDIAFLFKINDHLCYSECSFGIICNFIISYKILVTGVTELSIVIKYSTLNLELLKQLEQRG